MKLSNYFPTFRGVLFHEVREEKTKGGIFIPKADFVINTHSDMFEHDKEHKADGKIGDYIVVKTGKDCTEVKVGEAIFLMDGIRPQQVSLEDGDYFQVPEQQITGHG